MEEPMGIVFNEEKKVFLLNTKNTSYQFRIAEFGFFGTFILWKKGQ